MASFLELNNGNQIVLQDNKILDNFGDLRWNISIFSEPKNTKGRKKRYRALCEMFTMLRESRRIINFQERIERRAYETFRNELGEIHSKSGLPKQPANFFDVPRDSTLNIGFVALSIDKKNLYIDEHYDTRLCGNLTNYCFYNKKGQNVPMFMKRERAVSTPLNRVSSLLIDFSECKLILNGTIEWRINNLIYRDSATEKLCNRVIAL